MINFSLIISQSLLIILVSLLMAGCAPPARGFQPVVCQLPNGQFGMLTPPSTECVESNSQPLMGTQPSTPQHDAVKVDAVQWGTTQLRARCSNFQKYDDVEVCYEASLKNYRGHPSDLMRMDVRDAVAYCAHVAESNDGQFCGALHTQYQQLFNDELRESVEAHARERAQNQRSINSSADPLMDALLRADSKLNSCSATAVSVADCSVQYRAEINACLAFFRNLNQEKVPDFLNQRECNRRASEVSLGLPIR